ncbi:BQ2448_5566 [Microbotryum intermedium]|uniref:BQ2448_5566 protein n=1 Tax=Microbotryum intermedium TaxID=269621 RepID=A0A238EYF4_9BASI|nr:BQ2448_5566 [Microbotryum intermedium]
MFFARSGLVAATLLILQSTLSIAAPLSPNAVHELEKRITCQATEVAINNACVSCASLYKNASTCTRSVPLTCSYGVVNSVRKCAAVDCTSTPGTYLSTDGKQCLACNDPNALTCNSTTTFTCQTNYTLLSNNTCVYGAPYAAYGGFGLASPYLAKQQPFKPFEPVDNSSGYCPLFQPKARVIYYTGYGSGTRMCTGQNGPLDQNLITTTDASAFVMLKGYCTDFANSPYVTANNAGDVCTQLFIGPDQSPYTLPSSK